VVRRDAKAVGTQAELAALAFLKRNGMRCIRRNFHSRLGEIDLVMQDEDCLVFVEVRYRSSERFTRASVTVDRRKQRKIIRAAALFLTRDSRYSRGAVRFDVVAIHKGEDHEDEVEWIRDAFRPGEQSL
jgi:putative endonuclease